MTQHLKRQVGKIYSGAMGSLSIWPQKKILLPGGVTSRDSPYTYYAETSAISVETKLVSAFSIYSGLHQKVMALDVNSGNKYREKKEVDFLACP